MVLIAVGFLVFTNHSRAQSVEEGIGLKLGAHSVSFQDMQLSPNIQKDFSIKTFAVNYKRRKSHRVSEVEFGSTWYSLNSDNSYTYVRDGISRETFISSSTLVNLRYSTAWNLRKSAFHAGLMIDNQIRANEQAYGWTTAFNYFAAFSMGPVLYYTKAVSERCDLSLKSWIPVFAWVTRSPYALNDDDYMRNNMNHKGVETFANYVADGSLKILNRFQKFNAEARFDYSLSRRFDVLISYELEMLRYTPGRNFISYQNFVNLGAEYKF
ncbi:MAG TPA: hypothetical protein VGD40_02570 [Chryseosolibacter sp.]